MYVTEPAQAPRIRIAKERDAASMLLVEQAAQALFAGRGIDLGRLHLPADFEEPTTWSLGLVAEMESEVVGMARLTELSPELIALDQVSVKPEFASQGVGRRLLVGVADEARGRGYQAITGTTFREVVFNAPFYASLGCVEDPDPHPVMVQRRRVESELGLDDLGPRIIMRLTL